MAYRIWSWYRTYRISRSQGSKPYQSESMIRKMARQQMMSYGVDVGQRVTWRIDKHIVGGLIGVSLEYLRGRSLWGSIGHR